MLAGRSWGAHGWDRGSGTRSRWNGSGGCCNTEAVGGALEDQRGVDRVGVREITMTTTQQTIQ